jgi:N-acetylglutamate synthase-like GNAT family acetyltransferase
MVNINVVPNENRGRVLSFYARNQYDQAIAHDDILLIAEESGAIQGALRLCREEGLLVLRGMRVAKDYQERGIGRLLLRRAVDQLASQECFCIPHRHLRAFYQEAGFQEVDPATVPTFLADRLSKYRNRLGLDVILMRRGTEQPLQPTI